MDPQASPFRALTDPERRRAILRWGLHAALPLGLAAIVAFVFVLRLHEPILGEISTRQIQAPFHAQNVWCFDHMMRVLAGEIPLVTMTDLVGFPGPSDLRLVAWLPAALALAPRDHFGPLGAYNLVYLASPALSTLATALFLRRATRASWWVASALALTYGLCPYILGCLANGQVEKLHHWNFPLTLLAFQFLAEGRWRRLPLTLASVAIVTAAGVTTTPDTTIYLPFALCPFLLFLAWRDRERALAVLPRLALGLLVCVLVLLAARAYYSSPRLPGVSLAFEPGLTVDFGRIPSPSPVAQPLEILTGVPSARRQANPELSNHFSYLGLPLLLACVALSFRRLQARWLGWTLVLVGVVVSLGPRLVWNGAYVTVDGLYLTLPIDWLEDLGYPTAESGMYYRALVVSALGLALLATSALAGFKKPLLASLLAWGLAAGALADGYRVSATCWPRKVWHVPAMGTYMELARDPVPGAVLSLPILTTQYHGGRALLAAVYHRRATTALSRLADKNADSNVPRLLEWTREAASLGDTKAARAFFRSKGFRYAVWSSEAQNNGTPYEEFVKLLGEPTLRNLVPVWTFDDPEEARGTEPGPPPR